MSYRIGGNPKDDIYQMERLLNGVDRVTLRELYDLLGLTAWDESDRGFYERRLIKLGFKKQKAGGRSAIYARGELVSTRRCYGISFVHRLR
jgi:hypothetical protein